jgi:hypothetical protein
MPRVLYEVAYNCGPLALRREMIKRGREQIEWQYAKWRDRGEEGIAVLVMNLMDKNGYEYSVQKQGEGETDRFIAKCVADGVMPTMADAVRLESAERFIASSPDRLREHRQNPVPPGHFLVIAAALGGITITNLPIPD